MNVCLSSRFKIVAAIVVATSMACGSARADVHSDFDPGGTYFGGTEGWFNYSGLPTFTTGTPAGASSLWLEVQPQQYWGKITSQNWATPDITVNGDWNTALRLEFDIVVNELWYPNSPAQTVNIEFQVGGGVSGEVNQYANPTINTSLKNVVQHVTVPLAGMQPFDPTSTYWNLSFNVSPGYAWEWDANNPSVQPYNPRFFIDNVRWVPEPATMSLLAIAALAIVGVRRR